MKTRLNTGCGEVTLIQINDKGDALLQRTNGDYIVAIGYEEDNKGNCFWHQGHYYGKDITPAVLELADIDLESNKDKLTLLQVLQNCDCEMAVYNNVFDNEYPTWCGTKLTDYGKKVYEDLLKLNVVISDGDSIIIDIDIDNKEEELDEQLNDLFLAMAGYISQGEYDKRFID